MTKGEWMREHLGTDNERELARNPNIERYYEPTPPEE